MLENFVGSDNFIKGVSKYLKKYLYANAETSDLFNMLQEVTGQKVKDVMETWLMQMGYPVIDVKKNGKNYYMTQKRFLSNPDSKSDPSESKYGYKWTIPVTYTTSNNKTSSLIWFDKDQESCKLL